MSNSSGPEPLRERRLRETREALIDAAREAFAAEGLDRPSLDSICARAGLTRGAFYGHFRDREALIEAVQKRENEDFLLEVGRGLAQPDLAGIVEGFLRVLAMRRVGDKEAPGLAMPIHQTLQAAHRSAAVREEMNRSHEVGRALLVEAAQRAHEAGQLDPRVAPEEVAELLLVLCLGVVCAEELQIPIDWSAQSGRLLELLGVKRSEGTDAQ